MAFSIKAVFGLDASGLKTELKSVRKELNSFSQEYLKLGAAIAVGAFVALSKSAIDLAANLKDTALQVGINVEALQALQYAATQNGSSVEAMNKSLEKLRLNVKDAADGNATYADALKALGLYSAELLRLPLEQQYVRIGQAYRNAADKASAYNAVAQLFGERIGPQLLSTLDSLATDGFAKTAAAAKTAGQLWGTETIVGLAEASQAIDDFKKRATAAVGNIIVNFRSFEGLELLSFQLLKVVGVFGAKLLDELTEAGGMIKAVFWGEFSWVLNRFRDGFLDAAEFAAKAMNKILPDRFQINIAGIEELKSAGKDLGDTIIEAIAKTEPSTFAKTVTEYWDKAIADQQKVVDQLNKVDFGAQTQKLKDAGKSIAASAKQGADAFNPVMDAWAKNIASSLEVAHQMGGLLAGIRGGNVFNQLSDDALKEVIRQNTNKARDLQYQAKTTGVQAGDNIGLNLEGARLQAEALNAQRELDVRNRFRTDIARVGVDGARSGYDPVVFENLLRQFGPGSSSISTKQDVTNALLLKISRGIPTIPFTPNPVITS